MSVSDYAEHNRARRAREYEQLFTGRDEIPRIEDGKGFFPVNYRHLRFAETSVTDR